jgi:hypothetical protein
MDLSLFVQDDGTVRVRDSKFPALLRRPDGSTIDPVKVMVVELPDGVQEIHDRKTVILAWQDRSSAGPELIVSDTVDIVEFSPFDNRVSAWDGEYFYGPSGKCGCGSLLRRFAPWAELGAQVVSVAKR